MTQKEIDKFLTNTKVYVNGKSKEIQEKLFSLGFKWIMCQQQVTDTKKPFLYIDGSKRITHGDNMVYFTEHDNCEITANEILSIKFDEPKYRPFRDKNECWDEMLKHQPFGWDHGRKWEELIDHDL